MRVSSKKNAAVPRRRQVDSVSSAGSSRARESDMQERYAFRRNRTLTGSASVAVASAGSTSSAQLKSARVQAHDLAQHRRRLGVILTAVALVAVILFILVSQFTASAVVRSRDMAIKLDNSYVGIIDDYLKARPIERLRFALNTVELNQYMQSRAPEVSNVIVDGSAGLGASAFVITVRTPITGWTVGSVEQYVDETGTSFERNYMSTPGVQIVDESGVNVAVGQAVASNEFLGFVGRVVGLAGSSGYTVMQVVIPPNTTRQIALVIKDVPYQVKLSVDRPAGEQVEDMARSIRWLVKEGQSPEYLDVRVSGRAFYK